MIAIGELEPTGRDRLGEVDERSADVSALARFGGVGLAGGCIIGALTGAVILTDPPAPSGYWFAGLAIGGLLGMVLGVLLAWVAGVLLLWVMRRRPGLTTSSVRLLASAVAAPFAVAAGAALVPSSGARRAAAIGIVLVLSVALAVASSPWCLGLGRTRATTPPDELEEPA
ncbi:MAG TPA: hypothetical protein VGK35_06500 [Actinotalea sp.]